MACCCSHTACSRSCSFHFARRTHCCIARSKNRCRKFLLKLQRRLIILCDALPDDIAAVDGSSHAAAAPEAPEAPPPAYAHSQEARVHAGFLTCPAVVSQVLHVQDAWGHSKPATSCVRPRRRRPTWRHYHAITKCAACVPWCVAATLRHHRHLLSLTQPCIQQVVRAGLALNLAAPLERVNIHRGHRNQSILAQHVDGSLQPLKKPPSKQERERAPR